MNADNLPRTKPATKSSTIWSAVATILTSLAVLLGSFAATGEIPPLPLLLAEVPILMAQGKIIIERIKPNRANVRGLV